MVAVRMDKRAEVKLIRLNPVALPFSAGQRRYNIGNFIRSQLIFWRYIRIQDLLADSMLRTNERKNQEWLSGASLQLMNGRRCHVLKAYRRWEDLGSPVLSDFLFIPSSFFFLSIIFSFLGNTIITGLHVYF